MSWWNLTGSNHELMGDEAADAAAAMFRPVGERMPKPTMDELLDALEAVVRLAGPEVVTGDLGDRHIEVPGVRRAPGRPPEDLVAVLGPGLEMIAEAYRDRFSRSPTLREVLAAITFELAISPSDYVSGFDGKLADDLAVAT